jgi:hypothetical protein
MANELNIQLDPFTESGLTLIAKVFIKAGLQLGGSDVAMTESSDGFYTGNFALGSIADGDHIVKFQTTTDFYGSGILSVKDGAEVVPSTFNPSSDTIEGTLTHNAMMKLQTAALTGKVSGSPDGPIVIKGVDGSTTRISATVDEDGNRTAVTLTP